MPEFFAEPPISPHYHPFHYLTDMTDVTLGASGHWIGTRTGADSYEIFPASEASWSATQVRVILVQEIWSQLSK